jgi:proton-translocating NADH-quinone oxidoreductase chain N
MFTWVVDILLIFAVLTPLLGLLLRGRRHVDKVLCCFTIVGFALAGLALWSLYNDLTAAGHDIVLRPLGSQLTFTSSIRIDMLSIFMASIFLLLGLMVSIFSLRYMEHDTGHFQFYGLLLAMIAGMIGVVFAGDFFTLFLFWELMSISSYILVAFRKHLWESVEAGFKYLIMSAAGSALILLGIAFIYGLTGTVDFGTVASSLTSAPTSSSAGAWIYLAIALLVAGFGVKAAIVPFHAWLPDAHPAAPTPISALLSGVVIKTGVYAIIRSLSLVLHPAAIDWGVVVSVLAVFAAMTMTVGNVMALLQNDIKRLLAFSSIAQMGYIFLAVSVGLTGGAVGVLGLTAGLLHIMNHAIMKGLLFLCAGVFIYSAGTRNLDELKGIGHLMPVTAVIFGVGALAISGVPPFNGFVSELMIILSTLNAGMTIFAAIMLANILLGFAYYLRLLYITVWQSPNANLYKVREAPFSMLLPMGILMILCVVIGIWPEPFISFANKAAKAVMDVAAFMKVI